MSDRELLERYRMALEVICTTSSINNVHTLAAIAKKALECQPK